jgi:hypothetical protein
LPDPFGIWKIVANGHAGLLRIDPPDASGNFGGSVQFEGENQESIRGIWDESSVKIIFVRQLTSPEPTDIQVYAGYQFGVSSGVVFSPPGDTTALTFAGTFDVVTPRGGGSPGHTIFGWFAGGPFFGL